MLEAAQSSRQIDALKRYQALEMASVRMLGGWLPGIERWEIKHEVGMHLREDAKHSQGLRMRLWELRVADPDRGVAADVTRLMHLFASAQTDAEFLTGLYLCLKQALLDAYKQYVATTYSVLDAPSVAMLKPIIAEKEAQLAWARPALKAVNDSGEKQRNATRWLEYCDRLLSAHGGLSGQGAISDPPAPLPGYALRLPFDDARRDERFKMGVPPLAMPTEANPLDYTVFQFAHYGAEMQAAETLGSVLWEAESMPWEFYHDIAHHCSDEVRHSKLGEARLSQLGHHITDFPHTTGNYAWRQRVDPMRRFCALTYVIEADSFAYKNKSYQNYLTWGDQQSAESVLFDIIDETLHVRYGKKWVPELIKHSGYGGSVEGLVEECRELVLKNSLSPAQREAAASAGRRS